MRYFKRVKDNSYEFAGIEVGKIYPEDVKITNHSFGNVAGSVELCPENWEEVPKIEYIKQQGWCIKGSAEFAKWLKSKGHRLPRKTVYTGDCSDLYYYMEDDMLRARLSIPEGKVEVTIDQLNEIYNVKSKEMKFKVGDKIVILDTDMFSDYDNEVRTIKGKANSFSWSCNRSCVDSDNMRHATPEEIKAGYKLDDKLDDKQTEFKVGDEVLVTGWDFAKIRTPQKGLIKGVNRSFCDVKIEEDHHGKVGTWAFEFKFLEPLNKIKEMENFSVKVNETTFNILQELALENGYQWGYSGKKKIDFKDGYNYINLKRNHEIGRSPNSNYSVVSLEEAIDKITTKSPSFKEGEWVIVDDGGALPALVVYTNDKRTYGFGFGSGKWTDSFNIDNSRIWGQKMRKASKEQVESALIKEAKRRGFKVGVKAHNSNIGYAGTKVIKNNDFDYIQSQDKLALDFLYIYQKGKWAEILDEPKEIFGFKVTKTSNGDYKFGCSSHVYTQEELQRVVNTLSHLRNDVTVRELYQSLKDVLNA